MKDPRSPEWAYQAIEYLRLKWRHIDTSHEQFLEIVDEVIANKSWELIPVDHPYGDIDTLFREELGAPYKEVVARVKLAEDQAGTDKHQSRTIALAEANRHLSGDALTEARAEGGRKGGRPRKGDENLVKSLNKVSREAPTTDYYLRRLATIDADTGSTWIARFKAGEFPTVRAVARAAGIPIDRNVKLGNPRTVAQAVVRLMGKDYAAALAEDINSMIKGRDGQ